MTKGYFLVENKELSESVFVSLTDGSQVARWLATRGSAQLRGSPFGATKSEVISLGLPCGPLRNHAMWVLAWCNPRGEKDFTMTTMQVARALCAFFPFYTRKPFGNMCSAVSTALYNNPLCFFKYSKRVFSWGMKDASEEWLRVVYEKRDGSNICGFASVYKHMFICRTTLNAKFKESVSRAQRVSRSANGLAEDRSPPEERENIRMGLHLIKPHFIPRASDLHASGKGVEVKVVPSVPSAPPAAPTRRKRSAPEEKSMSCCFPGKRLMVASVSGAPVEVPPALSSTTVKRDEVAELPMTPDSGYIVRVGPHLVWSKERIFLVTDEVWEGGREGDEEGKICDL